MRRRRPAPPSSARSTAPRSRFALRSHLRLVVTLFYKVINGRPVRPLQVSSTKPDLRTDCYRRGGTAGQASRLDDRAGQPCREMDDSFKAVAVLPTCQRVGKHRVASCRTGCAADQQGSGRFLRAGRELCGDGIGPTRPRPLRHALTPTRGLDASGAVLAHAEWDCRLAIAPLLLLRHTFHVVGTGLS